MAYLSVYPKKEAFKKIENFNTFEADSSTDTEDESEIKVIDWQFNKLLKNESTKEELKTLIKD